MHRAQTTGVTFLLQHLKNGNRAPSGRSHRKTLRATVFCSALTHFFELGFIKPKTNFLRNPFLQNFRRPKKPKIGDGFRACILSPIARFFRIKHDRNRISSHGVLIGRFFNARRRCDKNVRSFFVSRGR